MLCEWLLRIFFSLCCFVRLKGTLNEKYQIICCFFCWFVRCECVWKSCISVRCFEFLNHFQPIRIWNKLKNERHEFVTRCFFPYSFISLFFCMRINNSASNTHIRLVGRIWFHFDICFECRLQHTHTIQIALDGHLIEWMAFFSAFDRFCILNWMHRGELSNLQLCNYFMEIDPVSSCTTVECV